jgi:Ca2+-binding RTX toxin-like protein
VRDRPRRDSEASPTPNRPTTRSRSNAFAGDDVLVGSAGSDTPFGRDGDDVLIGGLGQDVLDGGPGNNVLIQD